MRKSMKVKKIDGSLWVDCIVVIENAVDRMLIDCKNKKIFNILLSNTNFTISEIMESLDNSYFKDMKEISSKCLSSKYIADYYQDKRRYYLYFKEE